MRGRTHLIAGTMATFEISILCGLPIVLLTLPVTMICSVIPDIDEANSNTLSKLISKSITKKIHLALLFSFTTLSFYMYMKTGMNAYLGMVLSVLFSILVSKRLTSSLVRSIVISSLFFIVSLTLYLHKFNLGYSLFALIFAIYPLLKHRGISHSLLGSIIVFFIFTYIEKSGGPANLAYPASMAYLIHLVFDMATKRGVPLLLPFSKRYYRFGNLRVGSIICNLIENILIILLAVILVVTLIYSINLKL